MKKLIAVLLVMTMVLALSGCGPEGDPAPLNTGDASVTSADIPAETLPTVADTSEEVTSSDDVPVSEPEVSSEDITSAEPEVTSTTPESTSDAPATTTTKATTTNATTTTKAATTTQATTTSKAPETTTTTADPDDEWEDEDIVTEIIENLDEWFLSMGFETDGQGVNAND